MEKVRKYIFQWYVGWITLFVGLITIITLGFYKPRWVLSAWKYFGKKRYERTGKIK